MRRPGLAVGLDVAPLTALRVVEDLHHPSGLRVGEALAGLLPAGIVRRGLVAVAPALEDDAEEQHQPGEERAEARAAAPQGPDEDAGGDQQAGDDEQRRA